MIVMGFLAALPSEYDSAKVQILSSLEISSLQETFSRILRIEVSSSSISSPTLVSAQTSSALVGQTIESKRQQNRNSGPGETLEGLVLEVLFVIIAISMAIWYEIVRNDRLEIRNFSLLI